MKPKELSLFTYKTKSILLMAIMFTTSCSPVPEEIVELIPAIFVYVPTSTETPTPTPTDTPTPVPPLTPEEAILRVAEFSGNAEVVSANGKLTINYSHAVLAKRDIESISMDAETLDRVYSLIINNTYNSAGAAVGSEIKLKPPGGRSISGVVDNVRQYTVTYEEFPEIQKLLYDGGFEFGDYDFLPTSKALLFFGQDGALVIVRMSYSLRTPPMDWDRKDVDLLAIWDGPANLFGATTTTAIYGNANLSNKRTLSADPVYHLFGCNEGNSWCRINGSEKIDVVFNN